MSQYRKITAFILSTLFITHFAFAMESGEEEKGSTVPSQPPKTEPTTEELEEQLRRLKLQREIEEEKQRLAALQSGGTPESLVENLTGRSEEEVKRNVGKEAERGAQGVMDLLHGHKWGHTRKKEKKAKKKGK